MEIDKITFENLRTLGISSSFEDLDVNNDGKITKDDLSLTQDGKISSQIMQMLDMADDDAELLFDAPIQKAGVTKNEKSGLNELSASDFENNVYNSKGTTYVVLRSVGCPGCQALADEINKMSADFAGKANIYEFYGRSSNKEDNKLFWDLVEQAGAIRTDKDGSRHTSVPLVLKFVDGKLQGVVTASSDRGKAHAMLDKIEGTISANNTSAQNPATTATMPTTSTKTQTDKDKAAEELLAKYPIEGTSGSGYSLKNPEVAALKKAVEAGIISQLAEQGFSQSDIVDIINKAYPKAGIKNNDKGGYTVPNGSGADAKEFYNLFISEMSKATSPEVLAKKNEIKALNMQILTNNAKLDSLKAEISLLKTRVNEAIEEAIKESEEIAEEQKEEANKIVKEEINKYASSDGEVSYGKFQSSLSDRLDGLAGSANSKLSSVVMKMISAEQQMNVLQNYISSFSNLVTSNKVLSEKIKVEEVEVKKVEAQCSSSCPECVQRCDPIGFSANGVRYDFFVDKDNDGGLSNETEFLGATGGWEEMKALDKDNDGKVTVAEMSNIKMVMTAEDGTQTVKSVADVFGQNDSVDLNSYKSVGQDFSNGNTLLGTYSLSFNGQNINDAYNTMDTLSWLDDNYDFTDKENGIGRFAQGNTQYEKVSDYANELTVFELDYKTMEVKLGTAWEKLGITRSDITENLVSAMKKESEKEASEIENLFKKRAAEQSENTDDDCPECSVTMPEE